MDKPFLAVGRDIFISERAIDALVLVYQVIFSGFLIALKMFAIQFTAIQIPDTY